MTTSTPGCDLLQLIGLDMQYARWKPSNHSKQHSENNNNYHQQNNPRRNGYHRNAGSPQKHQEHSSHLANTAGKLSQSNPNLKWNNNNNNNCSQNNAAKNQTTQERRRDSSPWPLMGDDSGPEQSVSSTSSLSSAGGSRTAPTVNPGGSGDNHGRYDQGRGSRGPAGHHDPRRDGRQHIDYNQRKQAYQHYTNQQTYKNSNGYNAYQNVAANRNQQHQNHHHQQGFHQGGGNNRRGHQNRYYNTFLPNGANFNGNGTVMTANNSNNGAQKRFQNGGRYHEMQMTVRGRRAPFVSEPSLFPLTNDPRFIELIKAGTPPDKFLTKTNLVQITKAPQQLTNGSAWDELSKAVWNKFLTNQQTKETYEKKLTLWKCLYVYLKIVYPRYSLFMVGSTMSGFGSNTSDVDMCLMVRQSELDQRGEALYHLTHIMQHFISYVSDFFINIELIHAKVPILKFKYINDSLDIDLSCNNTVGIRNTHLLYCYAKYDWRVRPLVLVVKLWAQWHDINSAKATTISSYSLALMVLHFLQCGCHPAVLPSLQQLHAARFSAQRDVDDIDFHCDLPTQSITSDVNSQPIGQLLVDFFNYYDRFDYRQYAISVRQGCCLLIDECRKVRSSKNEPHQWKYLCIEEPFDLTNTARSVNNPESFQKIRNVIHQTAVVLNATGSLDSIFRLDLANGWTSHHLAQ